MKRHFLIILLSALGLCAFAASPQKGYRGFVEWNNSLTREPSFSRPGTKECLYYAGVSTSHGYQINKMFFVGAGVSLENNRKLNNYIVPVFLHGRTDLVFGRFTPFGDIRLGYNLTDGGGVYFSPSIGYRFGLGRKLGINVGVGATIRAIKTTIYEIVTTPEGYNTLLETGSQRDGKAYFSFRLGLDF